MSQFKSTRPFFADYLKQCTTLTTGAILVVATFIEKMFPNPIHRWLVSVSLVSLFTALVASTVAYTAFLAIDEEGSVNGSPSDILFTTSMLIMWATFLIGIGSFGLFFLINWHH